MDTQELEAQRDALDRQIADRKAAETAAAHFHDSEGQAFDDPVAKTDGVLRAIGGALQSHFATKAADFTKDDAALKADAEAALSSGDYVALAAAAAMLRAKQVAPHLS